MRVRRYCARGCGWRARSHTKCCIEEWDFTATHAPGYRRPATGFSNYVACVGERAVATCLALAVSRTALPSC
eukprot:6186743-Pleurochrysis_carterae.AAC.2